MAARRSHGALSLWLMHEDRKELVELLFALGLTLAFLALQALALGPMGEWALLGAVAGGLAGLWAATAAAAAVLTVAYRRFRVGLYERHRVFVAANLAASVLLQGGWAVVAAPAVRAAAAGEPAGVAVALWAAGLLSCLVAFYVVSAFFHGHLYRFVSLPVALVAFVASGVWLPG
jgi:hypothetical protein